MPLHPPTVPADEERELPRCATVGEILANCDNPDVARIVAIFARDAHVPHAALEFAVQFRAFYTARGIRPVAHVPTHLEYARLRKAVKSHQAKRRLTELLLCEAPIRSRSLLAAAFPTHHGVPFHRERDLEPNAFRVRALVEAGSAIFDDLPSRTVDKGYNISKQRRKARMARVVSRRPRKAGGGGDGGGGAPVGVMERGPTFGGDLLVGDGVLGRRGSGAEVNRRGTAGPAATTRLSGGRIDMERYARPPAAPFAPDFLLPSSADPEADAAAFRANAKGNSNHRLRRALGPVAAAARAVGSDRGGEAHTREGNGRDRAEAEGSLN